MVKQPQLNLPSAPRTELPAVEDRGEATIKGQQHDTIADITVAFAEDVQAPAVSSKPERVALPA